MTDIDNLLISSQNELNAEKLKEMLAKERQLELSGIIRALRHVKPMVDSLETQLKAANDRIKALEAQLAEAQAQLSAPTAAKGD
jgi:predicted  nucleic acid-binding Zn-ribbon protein